MKKALSAIVILAILAIGTVAGAQVKSVVKKPYSVEIQDNMIVVQFEPEALFDKMKKVTPGSMGNWENVQGWAKEFILDGLKITGTRDRGVDVYTILFFTGKYADKEKMKPEIEKLIAAALAELRKEG